MRRLLKSIAENIPYCIGRQLARIPFSYWEEDGVDYKTALIDSRRPIMGINQDLIHVQGIWKLPTRVANIAEERVAMGDKGRELIEVKYAWTVVAKKMREGYESVIRR